MKLSKVPFKTSKTRGSDEFNSVEILFQTGQIKRHSAGIYGFGNLMTRAMNKTIDLVRFYMDKYDGVEVSCPLAQAKSLWVASGRWDDYKKADTTFYCKGRDSEYFLSPTAEEAMTDLVRGHIQSYKDLNFNVYQIGKKFRDEIRVRGGLTRSKEFIMKDAYSFNDTKENLQISYNAMKTCYMEFFRAIGLNVVPVIAVNGGFGGSISEEIVCFSDLGSDKVLFDESRGIAINEEVLDDKVSLKEFEKNYQQLDISRMQTHTAIEVGHIFQLDQFYSKNMGLRFTTKEGKQDYCWMGCYGLGVSRALNVALEQNCDQDGLVFPIAIAPYKIGIVNLNTDEQISKATKLYQYFQALNIDIMWDDRDLSLGTKIKDMLLNGIPYMVIIGKNIESDQLEVEVRKTREKLLLTKEELSSLLSKY